MRAGKDVEIHGDDDEEPEHAWDDDLPNEELEPALLHSVRIAVRESSIFPGVPLS